MSKRNELTVFTMSDGTGQTAEGVALAAIRQFLPAEMKIVQECLPRIVNKQQIAQIMSAMTVYQPCIVVYTVVVPEFREKIEQEAKKYDIYTVDLINPIIDRISQMLGKKPRLESGLNQLLDDKYFKKIEAMEFAIKFDDGKDPKGIIEADVILIGVSRTSKTPTCMYLAQQKGIKAGNIPIVQNMVPPKELFNIPTEKIIGLTISPENLLGIRTSRLESLGLPVGSDYADYGKIIDELEYAESIMKRVNCRVIDVSKKAIEETAVDIISLLGKNKIK
ncbi:MAG: pyruvate, water dikinase regulatory protein [Candidatus Sericytochromatia bacterium]